MDEHYRVSQSQLLESGYIVACDVERGAVSQVQLSVAGESERWKESRLHQRWNDATQRALYPDDAFFSEQATANKQNLPDTQPGNYIEINAVNATVKLAAFINQRNCMPFQWGKNDCCLLVADWVRFATGKTLLQIFVVSTALRMAHLNNSLNAV